MSAFARTALPSLWFAAILLGANPASAFLAFVSNEKGNSISVVDTDKMETVATIPTGQRPRGIAVSRDGKSVFVAVGDDDTIQIFDTKTYQNVGELPSGPDPEQFALDPAGKRMYVANENDAMVTIIDVDKRLALGQISVGVEPEGMSVSPDFEHFGLHVGDDEHGAFHRHQEPRDRRQRAAGFASPIFRL